jgi:hypothetical protein
MAETVGKIIERKRGDTAPDVILVKDPDNPTLALNVTGFAYTLTVNTDRRPTTVPPFGTELLQIAGTLADPVNGRVEFAWSALNADQVPGRYWYDIQQIDAGARKKTIAKNEYVFYQDVTKV